jgi:hypothetical protein
MQHIKTAVAVVGTALLLVSYNATAGWHPHVHIPVHVPNPVPVIVRAATAPAVAVVKIATGKPVVPALKSAVAAQANALGQAATDSSAITQQIENVKVTVAGKIAGNVGQTVMRIAIGPERYEQAFAATAVIEGTEVLQGARASDLVAAPLAAALREAQAQFSASALPLPDAVKQALSQFYAPAQLANARYALSTISISVPDLITGAEKTFGDNPYFAVTVGNIMVFSRNPANNYHWWAHELQHTVQYSNWGIDHFAYEYVTSCHAVEEDAENHAQAAVPLVTPTKLAC